MSEYSQLEPEQMEELLSNFLISSWSHSKLSAFARNEKAFEMNYIFGLYSRSGATTIAGQAYHKSLQYYFTEKKKGNTIDLVEMEAAAFQHIDSVGGNQWKLQKTTPTVETCKEKAVKIVTSLLKNFYTEKAAYEDDIDEIIDIEIYFSEFVTVNGVDIPLPCNGVIDLVVKTKSGKIAIVDHKSKSSFTDEEEMALSIGEQAITYVLGYESKTGVDVSEVWFAENKYSQNKDKTQQLNVFKVTIDPDTRRLYEALLYEPVRRMISAVSDPDYVYLINQSDNYVDRAELYDFWARTMISEVEDFNVEESKKELVVKRLKKVRDASIESISPSVIKKFKENASKFIQYDLSSKNMTHQEKIEHVLRTFSIIVKVAHRFDGYSSSTFLLEASAGVKIASIYSHRLDLANALDVANVRIGQNLTVYEGKSYLSVEVAVKKEGYLSFDPAELKGLRIPIGKDNFNKTIVWDLENHSTPHMLICGATGSGKSACIKSILKYAQQARIDRIIILDPKFEFNQFQGSSVTVYNDIEEIEVAMHNLVQDMNVMVKRGLHKKTLVVFDEFADAVANSKKGNDLKIYKDVLVGYTRDNRPKYEKELAEERNSLEENLRVLLQKGRSSGFRIIAATQRASVKVITGDAKVNFPVQVCFRVPKEADSRVVIDEAGAESLAGMGDGLIKSPEYTDTVRFQSYYVKENLVTA